MTPSHVCCAVPCRAAPCRAVPCCAALCRAVPCRAVPRRAVPCRAVLCCAVLCTCAQKTLNQLWNSDRRKGNSAQCRSFDKVVLSSGRAFAGWHEGKLSFPPTFKFKRGTTQYLGHDEVVPAELQTPFQAGNEPPLMPTTVCANHLAFCLRSSPSMDLQMMRLISTFH